MSRLIQFRSKFIWQRAVPYIVVTAAFGVIAVVWVFAAGPITAFEAENGTLSAGATVLSLTGASGGKIVQFGNKTLPSPAPTSNPTPTSTPAATSVPTPIPIAGGTTAPDVGTIAWIDRITTTASGTNEIFPHGVPSSWDWAQGSQVPSSAPSGYTALTGWGIIYLSADSTPTSATFDITNFKVWMQASSGWKLNQQGSFSGAAYNEDFSGNSSVGISQQPITGGIRVGPIPSAHNFHYYFDNRALIPAGYTGKFVIAFSVKQNGVGKYGSAAGGDWWLNLSASYPNNAAIGQGRMMALVNGSETLIGYTNMTLAQLTASHP